MKEIFKDAMNNWPIPFCSMSRDVFERRKSEVLAAAAQYGFRINGASRGDAEARKYHAATVEFVK